MTPDRLWAADFTYVSTRSGWCSTAFVIDAVEQALLTRGREGRDRAGLLVHYDHAVQYLSAAFIEHLATAGIKPSTGVAGPRLALAVLFGVVVCGAQT